MPNPPPTRPPITTAHINAPRRRRITTIARLAAATHARQAATQRRAARSRATPHTLRADAQQLHHAVLALAAVMRELMGVLEEVGMVGAERREIAAELGRRCLG
ncbi:hypothetical protein NpPPO83_00011252 [Neofusicoccum parvum]|uniref:Uncharacterized protein n=1 Tax=Neofusicoccum parvum TaxID=310453 RepID=A0ACB5S9T3_9PEZI|nr:hypothetical protein NpPPO83_00011252 [Neofusicoccum parvum]